MADITVTAAKVAVVYPDNAEIYDFVAGATITAGQAVAINSTTGKLVVADASTGGGQAIQMRGIALNGGGAGQGISVLKRGACYGFTLAGDYDSRAYLSNTAGALADAAGDVTVQAGRVLPLADSTPTKVLYVDVDWYNQKS